MKTTMVFGIILSLLLSMNSLISGVNPVSHEAPCSSWYYDSSILDETCNFEDDMFYSNLDKPLFVPNELIIKFNEEEKIVLSKSPQKSITTGLDSTDRLNMRYRVISAEPLFDTDPIEPLSNIFVFTFPEKTNLRKAASEYANDLNVEFAEPNFLYHPLGVPNDPYFDMQWALNNTGQTGGTPDADIDAPEAWDLEQGDPSITIAIIDTGVDYTNPDMGNCTEGITEQDYILESSHPINWSNSSETMKQISFPEYDSVSLHLSHFDLGGNSRFVISNNVPGKIFSKKLFSGGSYNGTGANIWTKFSEFRSGNNIDILVDQRTFPYPEVWGYAIDKIKTQIWNPLSKISEKYADGYDFYYHNPDPMDDMGHGTHCAGIAAAVTNNYHGIAGVAGNCKILPIKVGGSGTGASKLSFISRAIFFAVRKGADIISLSLGGINSIVGQLLMAYANARGVIIVAAAGNENMNLKSLSWPASHKDVIAVAATDANDSKAWFSNYGPWVDVAAPGMDILSLRAHGTDMYLLEGSYNPGAAFVPAFDNNATLYRASGTSMACPFVAGVAALILSKNPNLTPIQVRTILRSSTDEVLSDLYIGTGRINAHTALLKTFPVSSELDDSLNGAEVKGTKKIKGIAEGEQFKGYEVEYALGVYPDEESWVLLANSSSPENGILASLDTTILNEGIYTIRLQVTAGNYSYEDRKLIIVNNKPNTFYVDDDNVVGPWYGTQEYPFKTIQNALDSCGSFRDEVYVYSGIYSEKSVLGKGINIWSELAARERGKSVKIRGENKNTTILDGSGIQAGNLLPPAAFILIHAKFVTITGFTFRNFTFSGIFGLLDHFNRIFDNCFVNNGVGLFLFDSFFNMIYNNNFISNRFHVISAGVNMWYNPILLRGNYWDDYEKKYPKANPRLILPWVWNIPYKSAGAISLLPPYISRPEIFRFMWNNDRFPLIYPS
ncbi:MAG: S8 family serine peptidase [Thermoplasmata archaeon]|nr:MAG: S8 family serine peptidase [Thermoplasmata archaeon]